MLALLVRYLLEEDTHKQVQHGLLTRVHTAPPSFFLLLSSFSPREMMGRGEAGVHRVSIECSVQRSVLALLVRYLLEQEGTRKQGQHALLTRVNTAPPCLPLFDGESG